jgi:hypothetical protein
MSNKYRLSYTTAGFYISSTKMNKAFAALFLALLSNTTDTWPVNNSFSVNARAFLTLPGEKQ